MAKLDALEVDGYKSIRELRLELRDLNVLIGANGAGKSNLVSVLGLLGDIVDGRLQLHVGRAGGANALLHFGQKRTPSLRVRTRFGVNAYEAELAATATDGLLFEREAVFFQGTGHSNPYEEHIGSGNSETQLVANAQARPGRVAEYVLAAMRGWKVFHFHDTSSSAPVKLKQPIDDNRALRRDAANLAAFLHALRVRAPTSYRRIVAAVQMVAPFFDDFVLEPTALAPDRIQLAWRHRGEEEFFGAHMLSDGTLRFMCLATLLLQPELPSLVVIDEPELGLHPFAIRTLAELVRSVSSTTQIVMATQSVTFLNEFSAEEVVVVDRKDEASTFRRLASEELRGWLDDYTLGELWEKNVFGATPFSS